MPPRATAMRTGRSDLSRMKGNFQVRFLEGGGLATACSHSTARNGRNELDKVGCKVGCWIADPGCWKLNCVAGSHLIKCDAGMIWSPPFQGTGAVRPSGPLKTLSEMSFGGVRSPVRYVAKTRQDQRAEVREGGN